MAIKHVVTRGFAFGPIAYVVARGYGAFSTAIAAPITFPINLPAGKIAGARIRHVNNVAHTRSVFTGEKQSQRYQGERLEYELTVRPIRYSQAGTWRALLTALYGGHGTFYYGDPDFLARGPVGVATGTPLIDGAGQLIGAETILTKGWTTGVTGILVAGDFIQIGTGSASRLHMILTTADSDDTGRAYLNIWPRLRASPANETPITVAGAKGVFELADTFTEYSTDQNSVFAFSFRIQEAL